MGINMDKMRQKLSQLQGNGNSNKDLFWRPPEGESTIRIVPTPDGDPFKDFWFHYNVGNNPGFLSPKRNFGDDCPLIASCASFLMKVGTRILRWLNR